MEDPYSVENIDRLGALMFQIQTSDNSQLLRGVLWISAELTIVSSLKHKNTQPLYIFNRVRVLHLDRLREGTWLHSFVSDQQILTGHMGTVEICPHLLFEDKFTRVADYVRSTHRLVPTSFQNVPPGLQNGAIYIYDQPWHLCTNNRKNSSKFHIWTREATNFVRI